MELSFYFEPNRPGLREAFEFIGSRPRVVDGRDLSYILWKLSQSPEYNFLSLETRQEAIGVFYLAELIDREELRFFLEKLRDFYEQGRPPAGAGSDPTP